MRELQTTSGLEGALDRRVRARLGFKNGRALNLESCESYRLAGKEGGSTNTLLRWEKRVCKYTAMLARGVYNYRLEWVGGVRELQTRVGRKVLSIGGCALVRVLKMDELCTSSRARITD